MINHRRSLAAATVIALVLTGTGCGDDRSVDAFCSTMRSEKERILGKLDNVKETAAASGDEFASVLITLGGSIAVIGELRTYFAKLAEVAPSEIEPQVKIVEKAFNDQLDSASDSLDDPLGALASSLMSSLTTSGQMNDVNEWAKSNCGEGI